MEIALSDKAFDYVENCFGSKFGDVSGWRIMCGSGCVDEFHMDNKIIYMSKKTFRNKRVDLTKQFHFKTFGDEIVQKLKDLLKKLDAALLVTPVAEPNIFEGMESL